MRRSRTTDQVDVMDKMNQALITSISKLSGALFNGQEQALSLNGHIKSIYKRRKLPEDAGRATAVTRYDNILDKLEDTEARTIASSY